MGKIITKKVPYKVINNVMKFVVEVRCDSVADDVTPPDSSWYLGSIAQEISTGKLYGLNSSGTWVEQDPNENAG